MFPQFSGYDGISGTLITDCLCLCRSPVTDSEEEDSAESSTDEEGDDPAIDSQEDRAE